MPRLTASVIVLTLGAAVLASCGEDDAQLLAGSTAQEIRENLDSVQQLVNEGECIGAEDQALQVSIQVESLRGIDPKLKQALEDGAARLNEVVDTCEEEAEEPLEETTPTTESEKEQEERVKDEEKAAKEQEKEEEKAANEQEQAEEKEQKEQEKEEEDAQKEEEKAEKEQAKGEPPPSESGGIGPAGEAGQGG
jgi:outer membrane biosynthesis protein TonB